MKHLNKILLPTDLSEHSRRALAYGSGLAAKDNAALVIVHVANELNAWQLSTEFELFTGNNGRRWPLDRIVSEASLDLNHFLEPTPSRRFKAAAMRDQASCSRQRFRPYYVAG